jgi:hypothetical protein
MTVAAIRDVLAVGLSILVVGSDDVWMRVRGDSVEFELEEFEFGYPLANHEE